MEDLIRINHLRFSYPNTSRIILNIPQFSVQKGEKVFLYGPSGCGKTTFLEIIAGVLAAQSGEYFFNQQAVHQMSPAQKDRLRSLHMGYIFQSFNLIPYLSVEENIALPLDLNRPQHLKLESSKVQGLIHSFCQKLGLQNHIHSNVTELSVGQQQRVALARALIVQPDLILADEPTSALDYDHREKFIQVLFQMCQQQGTSVLFVSHDRTLEKLFDRSVALPQINHVQVVENQLSDG